MVRQQQKQQQKLQQQLRRSVVSLPSSSSSSSRRVTNARSKDDVIDRLFATFETAVCPYILTENSKALTDDAPVLDYVFENVESFTCAEDAPHLLLDEVATFDTNNPNNNSIISNDEAATMMMRQPHTLQRDNSLVEKGPSGAAVTLNTTRRAPRTTATAAGRNSSRISSSSGKNKMMIQPLGSEGDILDYCFENAESYTCGQDGTSDFSSSGSTTATEPTTTANATTTTTSTTTTSNRKKFIGRLGGKHRKITRKPNTKNAEDEVQLYFRPQRH